ncbi:MAG: hypothetical protein R2867_06870 [Caldilineaceae bacterium]
MSEIARAIEKDETDGLVKLFVDEQSEEIFRGDKSLAQVAMRSLVSSPPS